MTATRTAAACRCTVKKLVLLRSHCTNYRAMQHTSMSSLMWCDSIHSMVAVCMSFGILPACATGCPEYLYSRAQCAENSVDSTTGQPEGSTSNSRCNC